MSTIHKVLIYGGFFAYLSLVVFPQRLGHLQPGAQELGAPPVATVPSSLPAQPQTVPWYRDPARTALAGAVAGILGASLAAFITGLINLRVRKLTNKHELQKLSLEKQLEVYGKFFEKIVEFDLIDPKNLLEDVFTKLIDLLAEFERSYPFLDKQTINVFNEQISIPFNNEEFVKMFRDKGAEAVYKEVRHRLMRHVLPTAKAFLDYFK